MKKTFTRAALMVAAILCPSAHAAEAAFDTGQVAYAQGDFRRAETHFRTAARGGDARAQEILGFMYILGSELFPGVSRDRPASQQWFGHAARNGRPVAIYMACVLRQRPGKDTEATAIPCRARSTQTTASSLRR